MAGHNYVTKGSSSYTDIPSRKGGYDHGPENIVHGYIVETTTIERVRGPITGYTNYSGSPSKIELLKEYGRVPHVSSEPKYGSHNGSPKGGDHYKGFEPNYGPNRRSSSPTRLYGPNYEISSPKHHYEPNHGNSSPSRHYRPNHGSSSPTRHYGHNYGNSSPTRHFEPEEDVEKFNKIQLDASRPRTDNFSSPNKYGSSSPTLNYNSEGARLVKNGSFPGQRNNWQSAGPPATRHPLTSATNDINEAISFLEQSVNHPVKSGPKKGGGALDDLSTRVQPVEPARRDFKPAFGRKANNTQYKPKSEGVINSKDAMLKYGGTLVP